MYTISENTSAIEEVKKSKFIAKIYKVYQMEEVLAILSKLKEQYQDSTHICYAYKLPHIAKFSDDGEPGGTAGLPMMEILNKQELTYVLVVVIRYFGGIKLGSGGLVRAYSKAVIAVVQQAQKKELVEGYKVQILCDYENSKKLDYLLKDRKDIDKKYQENITYTFQIEKINFEKLREWTPTILQEVFIEKDAE